MGTSYDGVYMFGSLALNTEEGWAEETLAALGTDLADDFDLHRWLDRHLGVKAWRDYPDYKAYQAAREAAQVAAFGCTFMEARLGYCEYAICGVCPVDAHVSAWRGGRVPPWTAEQIEHWRACMERLRAVLPGLDEPGLRFGCSVG